MQTVDVRRATLDDAEALALVAAASFLETFAGVLDGRAIAEHCKRAHSPTAYAEWLANPDAALWLAEAQIGRAPVGYALLAPPDLAAATPGDLELKRIYLLGRAQGSGVGRMLMEATIAEARRRSASRLLLGVYAGNTSAIAFYQKSGFQQVGDRRFSVGGELYDDFVFALDL